MELLGLLGEGEGGNHSGAMLGPLFLRHGRKEGLGSDRERL